MLWFLLLVIKWLLMLLCVVKLPILLLFFISVNGFQDVVKAIFECVIGCVI